MIIFDQSVVIKNTGTYKDVDSDMLDMLDGMLNEYGVDHSFTLPSEEKMDEYEKKGWEAVVVLAFMHEDEDTALLVYLLWMKYQREVTHNQLMKAMGKNTKYWIVWPDDPDLDYRTFFTRWAAEEWAGGLCCSYHIEEI